MLRVILLLVLCSFWLVRPCRAIKPSRIEAQYSKRSDCAGQPPLVGPWSEVVPTDAVVMWVVSIRHLGSEEQDEVKRSLYKSIDSVLHNSKVRVAYVILHDDVFTCNGLTQYFTRSCTPLERMEVSHDCSVGPRELRSNQFYLVNMVDFDVDDMGLELFSRYATARRSARNTMRMDLVKAQRGNNFRFIAHSFLLPLGVRRMLYLDYDTCVNSRLGWLLESNTAMPLVVAKRPGIDTNKSTWNSRDKSTSGDEMAKLLQRRYGFDKNHNQFNAGVMVMNTIPYCKSNIFGRMLDVARLHAFGEPLFETNLAFNQPFFEVAAAGQVHYVAEQWNCRHLGMKGPKCLIEHHKFCACRKSG